MAYVLGFFAADGYITVNRRGGQFWSIQITDRKLLENIKRVVGSGHKISLIKRRKIFGDNPAKIYRIYRLQIGSIEMCDDLRHLGMREQKTKSLAVSGVPQKYFLDFVRGYFDGDGNVWRGFLHKERKNPTEVLRVCFTSSSKNFLKSLQKSLERYKVFGRLRCEKTYFRLYYSVQSSLLLAKLMYYYGSTLYLRRKKRVFDNFVKMRL